MYTTAPVKAETAETIGLNKRLNIRYTSANMARRSAIPINRNIKNTLSDNALIADVSNGKPGGINI